MPLDEVGRRYADKLFQNRLEEIQKSIGEKIVAVRGDFGRRNMMGSGAYFAAYASVLIERIDLLGKAKADCLLQAYDKAGLAFDDSAVREIGDEAVAFCHKQQHNAIDNIGQMMMQAFGMQRIPPGLGDSITQQLIRGTDVIMSRIRRGLSIKRDEIILDEMRIRKVYAAGLGKKWDVFVCHASEDKDDFVRPLAQALEESGLLVWYDEFALSVGDSLRQKIEEGLAQSRYGVVVVSDKFFAKNWPQHELDGLMTKEVAGTKVILPVWHNISASEVRAKSPMLAGLLAANSGDGVPVVVQQLRKAMGL